MKLRYTGPVTVTFTTAGVGEVEPGAEFTVPDELADAFLRRDDIEEVVELPEDTMKLPKKKAAPEHTPEPLLVPEPLPEAVEAAPAETTETL